MRTKITSTVTAEVRTKYEDRSKKNKAVTAIGGNRLHFSADTANGGVREFLKKRLPYSHGNRLYF